MRLLNYWRNRARTAEKALMDAHKLTGAAAQMRADLLHHADLDEAAAVAHIAIDTVMRVINDQDISSPSSIVARALVAASLIETTATWWAHGSVNRPPAPLTFAVVRSLVEDLPPQFVMSVFKEGREQG